MPTPNESILQRLIEIEMRKAACVNTKFPAENRSDCVRIADQGSQRLD